MTKLLRADLQRLVNCSHFWLSIAGMLGVAAFLMYTQATAMDYTVPLSRVIFLPLSMYAIVMSAFISVFIGTDFSDGFIRNKLLAAENRNDLVLSYLITCSLSCFCCYVIVSIFSAGVGWFFFENDIEKGTLFLYFLWGIGMSLAIVCLFSVVTLLCGNKTAGIIWCMGIAFAMLFLCLHTNELLARKAYKNGVVNPYYIDGFRRELYGFLHDFNPYGQAAQLSSWNVLNPVWGLVCDLFWIFCSYVLGCSLFRKRDIK